MTSSSPTTPRLAFALTGLLLPAMVLCQSAEPAPPFSETIEVREVELLFDISPLPRFESIGKKGIEDFAAFEAGAKYDLLELEESSASDWVHVLYFDTALAGPAARAAAAMALAGRATTLTAGGRVEIVVADPRPRLLTATAHPEMLERALSELAAHARNEAEDAGATPAAVSIEIRARQLDRLVVELAGRGGGGPRALWLAVDGWPLSPEQLERWGRDKRDGVALEPAIRGLAGAGRALAGYGWVTYPIAIRAEREEPSPRESERRMQVSSGGAGDERTTVPVFTVSGAKNPPGASTEAQLATLTDFSLAPIADLARTTSGALIGHETRLRSAMSELVRRRRATYRGPRPAPGSLLPIEIRWRGGDGRVLPATRFLRASTPPEVSVARLRALLAGGAAPVAAGITLNEPRVATLVAARDLCFSGEADELPTRVSIAREKKDGSVELHVGEVRTLVKEGGRLCTGLSLPFSADETSIAWIAENLDTEIWTGAVEKAP